MTTPAASKSHTSSVWKSATNNDRQNCLGPSRCRLLFSHKRTLPRAGGDFNGYPKKKNRDRRPHHLLHLLSLPLTYLKHHHVHGRQPVRRDKVRQDVVRAPVSLTHPLTPPHPFSQSILYPRWRARRTAGRTGRRASAGATVTITLLRVGL